MLFLPFVEVTHGYQRKWEELERTIEDSRMRLSLAQNWVASQRAVTGRQNEEELQSLELDLYALEGHYSVHAEHTVETPGPQFYQIMESIRNGHPVERLADMKRVNDGLALLQRETQNLDARWAHIEEKLDNVLEKVRTAMAVATKAQVTGASEQSQPRATVLGGSKLEIIVEETEFEGVCEDSEEEEELEVLVAEEQVLVAEEQPASILRVLLPVNQKVDCMQEVKEGLNEIAKSLRSNPSKQSDSIKAGSVESVLARLEHASSDEGKWMVGLMVSADQKFEPHRFTPALADNLSIKKGRIGICAERRRIQRIRERTNHATKRV